MFLLRKAEEGEERGERESDSDVGANLGPGQASEEPRVPVLRGRDP